MRKNIALVSTFLLQALGNYATKFEIINPFSTNGLNGVRVAHLFSFRCSGLFWVIFVFVLCLVYPMLIVSLIVHS